MAKSVYYYWREASSKADPYQGAKEHITQIFNAHRGRYGYRRIQLAHPERCLLPQPQDRTKAHDSVRT